MPVLAGVIVDLTVWGLNKELTYLVPEALIERVRMGSIVRVPLRNRRVRGWVVSLAPSPEVPEGVVDVAAVSGRGPVFDQALTANGPGARPPVRPAAQQLSVVVHPAPAGPGGRGSARSRLRASAERDHGPWSGLPPLRTRVARSTRRRSPSSSRPARGAIVAVPEVREGSRVPRGAGRALSPTEAAVVHTGVGPGGAQQRRCGALPRASRRLVLGGRGALFAPAMPLGLIVLHQEHDPSFKHQQAPYYDARVVARAAGGGHRRRRCSSPAPPPR